jgi:hypothetical protein
MQVSRQLRRPEQEVVARREPLLNSCRFVAREAEQPRKLDGVAKIGARGIGASSERCARGAYSP